MRPAAVSPCRPGELLDGPRGRRFLLELALRADELAAGEDEEYVEESLHSAVFLEGYHLSQGTRMPGVMFGPGAETARRTRIPAAEVARRLEAVPLPELDADLLRLTLADAVEHAAYWQPPEGSDILAALPELRAGLLRIAEHLLASPLIGHWADPVGASEQHVVGWDEDPPVLDAGSIRTSLRRWHAKTIVRELNSHSGVWWSAPSFSAPSSAGVSAHGVPAALWFVEDSMGWDYATTQRIVAPATGHGILELCTPEDWVDLCRRFPLDLSAQKRGTWDVSTGREGAWVIPDWSRVAEEYEGVHLSILGYLRCAGRALPVDEERSSVIAGWDPDETYWFVNGLQSVGRPTRWRLVTDDPDPAWVTVEP